MELGSLSQPTFSWDPALCIRAPFPWVQEKPARHQDRILAAPAQGNAGPCQPCHAPLPLQNPPNFLRASALSEHISPVVVIPAEAPSPDSEPTTDLVEMDTASQVSQPGTARAPWAEEGMLSALQLRNWGSFSKTMLWGWPWMLGAITARGCVGDGCHTGVLSSISAGSHVRAGCCKGMLLVLSGAGCPSQCFSRCFGALQWWLAGDAWVPSTTQLCALVLGLHALLPQGLSSGDEGRVVMCLGQSSRPRQELLHIQQVQGP